MLSSTLEFYNDYGYAGPFRGIERDQALAIADWVEGELDQLPKSKLGHLLRYKFRDLTYERDRLLKTRNRHLDYGGLSALLEEHRIMDPIYDILGESVALWRTQIFEMSGSAGLKWHTDEYRTLLDPIDQQVSAQIAFTPSSEENCVWVMPKSHEMTDTEILENYNLDYIEGSRDSPVYGTSRYNEKGDVPEPVKIVMDAGEFFIFHPRCLHRSSVGGENTSGRKRLAMAFRFASAQTKISDAAFAQTKPRQDKAVIVQDPRASE